jgi:hypothetical protein
VFQDTKDCKGFVKAWASLHQLHVDEEAMEDFRQQVSITDLLYWIGGRRLQPTFVS